MINPLFASVVAARLPPTVNVPLSVILLPLVRVKFPPTEDAATLKAVIPLSIVALPVDPVVLKVTAPVSALTLFKVMSALLALVVNEEVPAIVNTPESVMLPVVAVALSAPPTVDAAKSRPASFTTVAAPLPFVVS